MHMCGGCERKLVSNLWWDSLSLTTFDPGTNEPGMSGSWKTSHKINCALWVVDSTKHSKREKNLFDFLTEIMSACLIITVFSLWRSHPKLLGKETNSLEEPLQHLDSPQKLRAKRSDTWIYNFLKFQEVCSQTHQIYTQGQEMASCSLSKHLHQARLLLGHNFLLLVWRNGVGKSNFPRFPRTSFTCMCVRPKSIRIKADLVFVVSHCRSYKSGRIFLFMVSAKTASSSFSKLDGFEASRWNKWGNHIKEIETIAELYPWA